MTATSSFGQSVVVTGICVPVTCIASPSYRCTRNRTYVYVFHFSCIYLGLNYGVLQKLEHDKIWYCHVSVIVVYPTHV